MQLLDLIYCAVYSLDNTCMMLLKRSIVRPVRPGQLMYWVWAGWSLEIRGAAH